MDKIEYRNILNFERVTLVVVGITRNSNSK